MLFDQLQADLKTSMLQKEEVKTSVLRMLLSEVKNESVRLGTNSDAAKGSELSDEQIISLVQKEIKRRKEAAAGFRQGGREDNAVKEEQEAEILSVYLPAQMSDEELTAIINQALMDTGATSMTDMGKVLGVVRAKVGQSADPAKISHIVKEKLAS